MTALPRAADRSWWLEEALADPALRGEDTPPLGRDVHADVVVIGGGYTGMWTAYFLKEREPGLDVVLLEQDICGGGPSGRNGGFLNAYYDDAGFLISRFGDEGRRTVEIAARSIDGIGEWAERHGVDIGYERAGDLGISTSPRQDADVEETLRDARRLDLDDVYRPLSPERVRERFDSPVARGGVEIRHAAGVQPARLARALRLVLLQRGVRIFEGTPVSRFSARPRVIAETSGGRVTARRAVLGINAWAVAWRAFRRRVMARGTYVVVTAPAPDALATMNWRGGGVYDFRTSLHYLRRTPDGRVAFGGAGLRVAPQRIDGRYRYDERSVAGLVEDLRRWFPTLADVALEAAWGGPVDVSGYHVPFYGTLPGGSAHYGLGFTGNGVGPCHLGGRILSGLALGVEDETTTLPLVGLDAKRFPREPFFTPGERLISHAILRKDALEDEGRTPSAPLRLLAGLPRKLGYHLGP
ncbi:MAG TPA: FAD-binding oxidoreductase [Actinomycetota bacterium]|nr:FAD-binding oxidoreductase [Actinomycetota bacterium]